MYPAYGHLRKRTRPPILGLMTKGLGVGACILFSCFVGSMSASLKILPAYTPGFNRMKGVREIIIGLQVEYSGVVTSLNVQVGTLSCKMRGVGSRPQKLAA